VDVITGLIKANFPPAFRAAYHPSGLSNDVFDSNGSNHLRDSVDNALLACCLFALHRIHGLLVRGYKLGVAVCDFWPSAVPGDIREELLEAPKD